MRATLEPISACPADPLLRLLWGQWKTHVLYLLGEKGPARFGEMQRLIIGISPKVLTQRLRELEADGSPGASTSPPSRPRSPMG